VTRTLNHIKLFSHVLTSFWRAEDAQPRDAGSRARSVVNRPKADSGNSLKASKRPGLYVRGGRKDVDSLNFLQ